MMMMISKFDLIWFIYLLSFLFSSTFNLSIVFNSTIHEISQLRIHRKLYFFQKNLFKTKGRCNFLFRSKILNSVNLYSIYSLPWNTFRAKYRLLAWVIKGEITLNETGEIKWWGNPISECFRWKKNIPNEEEEKKPVKCILKRPPTFAMLLTLIREKLSNINWDYED